MTRAGTQRRSPGARGRAGRAASASAVTAELGYLLEGEESPVFYAAPGGAEVTRYEGRFDRRAVVIRNGRERAGGFSLDREGFALLRARTRVTDFYDDREIEEVYFPEVERLVARFTGASRVVAFDHTRRADSQALREDRAVRDPARSVHNDYTERSAPRRVRDFFPPAEAEFLVARRFAVVNLWRPIARPVETAPLALCDARSVAPEDLVASERRAKDRIGEIYQARFNPKHRWYYFPRMRRDEVLLIKTYDSAGDGRAAQTLHTAFDDPTSPPGAAPRESIEVRTFVFF